MPPARVPLRLETLPHDNAYWKATAKCAVADAGVHEFQCSNTAADRSAVTARKPN